MIAKAPQEIGSRTLDRSAKTPLWRQVHDDVISRADAGEFAEKFPGELTLAAEYGVSRATVREALRRLRAAGVVSGERGRTSRLADPAEISQAAGTLHSLFISILGAGQRPRSLVRRLDVRADGVVADRLNLDGSVPLVHLERVRMAGDRPLALDRAWLPASIAGPLVDVDFTEVSLYAELERLCGILISGGDEVIRAVVPTPVERTLLGISESVAAFSIQRVAYAGKQPIEWRHTLIRGDRFALNVPLVGQSRPRVTSTPIVS